MPDDTLRSDLRAVKRLLMLLLLKLGATSEEVALALEVDPSAVRKTLPVRKVKKIAALS